MVYKLWDDARSLSNFRNHFSLHDFAHNDKFAGFECAGLPDSTNWLQSVGKRTMFSLSFCSYFRNPFQEFKRVRNQITKFLLK